MTKESEKDKSRRKLALQKKYSQRITIARQGRDDFTQKDYLSAMKKYNEYLGILAELNDAEDVFELSPTMFDNKKEVTEMLLISHIYWEIARMNEMTPKLQNTYQKALSQFIKFTINQPYQILNAEMLRKYIKKNKGVSQQIGRLNEAHQQIFVQSKKCYIATMCYGSEHQNTMTLRKFKLILTKTKLGLHFIDVYYRYSSRLVSYCEKNGLLKYLITSSTRPILTLFAKALRSSIFK